MPGKVESPFEHSRPAVYNEKDGPGLYDKHNTPSVGKPADVGSDDLSLKFFDKTLEPKPASLNTPFDKADVKQMTGVQK